MITVIELNRCKEASARKGSTYRRAHKLRDVRTVRGKKEKGRKKEKESRDLTSGAVRKRLY